MAVSVIGRAIDKKTLLSNRRLDNWALMGVLFQNGINQDRFHPSNERSVRHYLIGLLQAAMMAALEMTRDEFAARLGCAKRTLDK